MLGWSEDEGSRLQHVRKSAGIIRRIGLGLGNRHMTGCLDEAAKFPIGDRDTVNPEGVDRDAMDRRFFGIMSIRTHPERAAGDLDHARIRVIL